MKHILVAVIGSTPQVLTETFWALRVNRRVPIEEIFVFTTTTGKKACEERLFEEGRFARLLGDCGIPPDAVAFDPKHILVFEDAQGNALEDIRTSEDNQRAQDAIFRQVETWTQNDDVALHGSLAGGRKSMGFLMGAAIQFFGRPQDRLYHVLVHPPQVENSISFYYPTPSPEPIMIKNRETQVEESLKIQGRAITSADVRIELADMPICRLRPLVQFAAPGYYTDETLSLTEQAIDDHARRIQREYAEKAASGDADAFPEIVGYSQIIARLKDDIRAFAPFETYALLLSGPTGSGKELVAKAIHKASTRRNKPFVAVNCATLRPELAMSQLFGHKKGAFTGADRDQIGYFEQAHGGTLFLDEINSLLPEVQGMLLRVMEDRLVPKLGGKPVGVDVRLIAATNENPDDLVRKGAFRGDLRQRFETLLSIPSLKSRPGDIPALAFHFLNEFNREHNARLLLDAGVISAMETHNWPGNVRELRNAIRSAAPRALSVGTSLITRSMLFSQAETENGEGKTKRGLRDQSRQFQIERIQEALKLSGGNKTQAARILGMDRTTLSKTAKRYGLA